MNDIQVLTRQLERERKARKQAELIMEKKAIQLYEANTALKELNTKLEKEYKFVSTSSQNLLDTIPDIVFRLNSDGEFSFFNRRFRESLGLKINAWIGQHFTQLVIPQERSQLQETVNNWVNSRAQNLYIEVRVYAVNNNVVWLGLNARKVLSAKGTYEIAGVARDITQRKGMEIALKKAQLENINKEHKYKNIIENMKLGLLEVDKDDNILQVNKVFCRQTGHKPEELIGKKANAVLLTKKEQQKLLDKQNKRRQKGLSDTYELEVRHKSGKTVWMLVSATPLYNLKNEIIGSIGIHYDISAMKLLQNDLRSAKEIAEKSKLSEQLFLANMSHEIRTPLNGIIGMTHLIKETSLSIEQTELVQALSSSSDLLFKLINNILDLSKLEAGKLKANNIQFDLIKLAHSTAKSFSTNLSSDVIFTIELSPDLYGMYIGDELLLSQVIFNLIGNAVKFTSKGSIAFGVDILESNEESDLIRFKIEDTGIGIEQDNIHTIFEKYDQATNEIRNSFGGTGLGLPISRKLVQLMGGQLKVKSLVGIGSTFYFDLWLKKSYDSEPIHFTRKRNSLIIKTSEPILVVDDNDMNLKYASRLLDKWHIEYDLAHDGHEAVQMALQTKYSVILMDLQMPVLNGFSATNKIKSISEVNKDTPIIALTASALSHQMEKAKAVGMADFLTKPFSPEQLMRILNLYLEDNGFFESIPKYENQYSFSPALDSSYLFESYANDYVYALDMFETFTNSIPIEIVNLESAAEMNDYPTCRKIAHKIKPTFKMVGLSKLSEQCKSIEYKIDQNRNAEAIQLIHKITPSMHSAIQLIEQEIEKIKQYLNSTNHAHSNS